MARNDAERSVKSKDYIFLFVGTTPLESVSLDRTAAEPRPFRLSAAAGGTSTGVVYMEYPVYPCAFPLIALRRHYQAYRGK